MNDSILHNLDLYFNDIETLHQLFENKGYSLDSYCDESHYSCKKIVSNNRIDLFYDFEFKVSDELIGLQFIFPFISHVESKQLLSALLFFKQLFKVKDRNFSDFSIRLNLKSKTFVFLNDLINITFKSNVVDCRYSFYILNAYPIKYVLYNTNDLEEITFELLYSRLINTFADEFRNTLDLTSEQITNEHITLVQMLKY